MDVLIGGNFVGRNDSFANPKPRERKGWQRKLIGPVHCANQIPLRKCLGERQKIIYPGVCDCIGERGT